LSQKVILIVDDDEDFLQTLIIRLRTAGYKAVGAADGMQAVMMAHKHDPDLMVLDMRMPAGDGLSVMDKMSRSTKTMNIPVIIVTAYDDEATRQQVLGMGAINYLRKPFEVVELLKAIEDAFPGD
jgi:two-component system phosphate regulon response regulator PhoB